MAGAAYHLPTHGGKKNLLPGPFPNSRHPKVACSPWLVATSLLKVHHHSSSSCVLTSLLVYSLPLSCLQHPFFLQPSTSRRMFPFHLRTGCGWSILPAHHKKKSQNKEITRWKEIVATGAKSGRGIITKVVLS